MKEQIKKIIININSDLTEKEVEDIIKLSYQLTAYESCGCFDFEAFLLSQFRECHTLTTSDYSEYAIEEAEDEFYENDDDILDMFFARPSEAIRSVTYGNYRFLDNYVKFDGNGNLKSFNNLNEVYDEEDVIRYCIINQSYDDIDFIKENQELIEEISSLLVMRGY